MTPIEAIEVIENMANSIQANRASWKKIEEAIQVLQNLVASYGVAKSAEVKKT